MGHTYSQIYLHIVWGTKDRNPIIVEQIEKDIHAIIRTKAKEYNSEILAKWVWYFKYKYASN